MSMFADEEDDKAEELVELNTSKENWPFQEVDLESGISVPRASSMRTGITYFLIGLTLFVVAAAALWTFYKPQSPSGSHPWNHVRLPSYIRPIQYEMSIQVDMEPKWHFSGRSNILVNITQPTDFILLHSVDLQCSNIELKLAGTSERLCKESLSFRLETANEFLVIYCPELSASVKNLVEVHIDFAAPIADTLVGFYRSRYSDKTGEKWLAVTDFEPANARNAFPCFDEPAMKAKYRISMNIPSNYNALANTPSESVTTNGDRKTYVFGWTPVMSSYLICYSVNQFAAVETITDSNVTVRVWSQPERVEQGRYALRVAKDIISHYEKYYGISYPLPKQDLIAIPDFSAGAMENWGLITFRETALLYDPSVSSLADKRWVATVVAHELAHQWFGNLVTMQWWDDLWLNEGFASYVEYLGTSQAEPTWEYWTLFPPTDLLPALELDAMDSSHPIMAHVLRPSEVGEIFDGISYSKGGSVLRMLDHYLSLKEPSLFPRGLHKYLSEHAYSNAQTSDLWRALSETSGVDVASLMDKWCSVKGFPLVTIESTTSGRYKATQSVFTGDGRLIDNQTLWKIPFGYRVGKGKETMIILSERETELPADVSLASDFITFNPDAMGYYRVWYPKDLRTKVVAQLESQPTVIPTLDRFAFVSDLLAFEKSGKLNPIELLELLSFMAKERDYMIWSLVLGHLVDMENKMATSVPSHQIFREWVLSLLTSALSPLEFKIKDTDPFATNIYKGTVINYASKFGHRETIAEALNVFNASPQPLPDLRAAVYDIAVANGGLREFSEILKRYNTTVVAAERSKCLHALAQTRDPALVKYLFDLILEAKTIRSQDGVRLLSNLAGSSITNLYLAWDFVRANFNPLKERYGRSHSELGEVVRGIAGRFSTKDKYNEVKDFFNSARLDRAESSLRQTLEGIAIKVAWIERNAHLLESFLQAKL